MGMIPIATIVEDSPESTLHPIRAIRSFVRRTGRTTAGQAKAFADVGRVFNNGCNGDHARSLKAYVKGLR